MSDTVTPAGKNPVTVIGSLSPQTVGCLVAYRAVTSPTTLDRCLLAPRARGLELVRAHELAGGLWCLRLPLAYPRTRTVNVYLLGEGTLLDCGSAVGAGWEA